MDVRVVLDVDGVVSPYGTSLWTDDVVAARWLGPVYVSPTLVAHLDQLSRLSGVRCVWLTDWTPEMIQAASVFPGRDWPVLNRVDPPSRTRGWWKLARLEAWLRTQGRDDGGGRLDGAVVWIDDDMKPGARMAACRRRLEHHGLDCLLMAPGSDVGITPGEWSTVTTWLASRLDRRDRPTLDVAWRASPVAPCGCPWDGYHCPHCGSVTDRSGDAWTPAHTMACHRKAQAHQSRRRTNRP